MRNVLITGGTGGFGRAFTRHILDTTDVERVCILSRGEHAQADMRRQFKDDPRLRFFIRDVRDVWGLKRAFQGVDTVIHGAALKRIEVGFYDPEEVVKTNVLGAMNVIEAARSANVERVIALSTDKACQPISAYGQSKAMAESLFLASNHNQGVAGPVYSVVRYGNVAGSPGSVIPIWREMLKTTSELPVTDPECTRFWMTMEEAVGFVAATVASRMVGGPFIPELPAYRLGDLAYAMGAQSIRITGLPAWEKKNESMKDGEPSNEARRMSIDELRKALTYV